jgi:hypothetical protein
VGLPTPAAGTRSFTQLTRGGPSNQDDVLASAKALRRITARALSGTEGVIAAPAMLSLRCWPMSCGVQMVGPASRSRDGLANLRRNGAGCTRTRKLDGNPGEVYRLITLIALRDEIRWASARRAGLYHGPDGLRLRKGITRKLSACSLFCNISVMRIK